MNQESRMSLQVRKVVSYIEKTCIEGGKPAEKPLVMIVAAAVIRNPWAGRPFQEDLRPGILAAAPPLGELLVGEILRHAGSAQAVEAYGKAAVVGTSGEVEHASALIHTLRFGNAYRGAVQGTSYLSFTNTRGGPGCVISIPMMHKLDEGLRSHYLTMQTCIYDAPAPDEIVIALGAATAGRPHHRIGNRYSDMKELEQEAQAK